MMNETFFCFDGIIVEINNDGTGVVEIPSEFRSHKFSMRCYYSRGPPLFPARLPVKGDAVDVFCSPTSTQLLSVREKK